MLSNRLGTFNDFRLGFIGSYSYTQVYTLYKNELYEVNFLNTLQNVHITKSNQTCIMSSCISTMNL